MKHIKAHTAIKYLSLTATFAAITFVLTYTVSIPTIAGYIHPGDFPVFLAASLLPSPYAMLASALGAALADLSAGYVAYIPVTVAVRVLTVLAFSPRGRMLSRRNLIALALAFLIYGVGYFSFDWLYYGTVATALAALPLNLLQVALSAILFAVTAKSSERMLKRFIPSPKEKTGENSDSR